MVVGDRACHIDATLYTVGVITPACGTLGRPVHGLITVPMALTKQMFKQVVMLAVLAALAGQTPVAVARKQKPTSPTNTTFSSCNTGTGCIELNTALSLHLRATSICLLCATMHLIIPCAIRCVFSSQIVSLATCPPAPVLVGSVVYIVAIGLLPKQLISAFRH